MRATVAAGGGPLGRTGSGGDKIAVLGVRHCWHDNLRGEIASSVSAPARVAAEPVGAAFVLIEGCASVSTDPDEVLRASTLNARRYVGAERAEEYGRLNAGEGMLLVRITPEKVVSENNITGEQEQATIMSTGRR